MKLFLLETFGAFSALRSVALFSTGIDGNGVVSVSFVGVATRSVCVASELPFFRNDFVLCLLLAFVPRDRLLLKLEVSSAVSFTMSSICPATVFPSVPIFSSAICVKITRPRSGPGPSVSWICCWRSRVFRLLVTGCKCDCRADIAIVYAGSKEPPNSKHAECVSVTIIEDSM